MIDQIYTILQTILNKEHAGFVSPTEFNSLAKQTQEKIFRGYFEDENRDKNRENRGLTNKGYSNLSFNQRQRLYPFTVTSTLSQVSGSYSLPSDLYLLEDDGILSSTGKVIEEAERYSIGYAGLSIAAPSETYPVYEHLGNNIKVIPASLTGDISVRYIRKPLDPKWTFRTVDNNPLYDPTNASFQDFELHPSEFSNIVIEMTSYFGINLRERDVIQLAQQLKLMINQSDNS